MNLRDKTIYRGEWWLPDSPEKRYAGTLTYDPEYGSSLELYGNFKDSVFFVEQEEYDIVLGLVEGSKEVTLIRTFMSAIGKTTFSKGHEVSPPICSYYVECFLIGCHLASKEEMLFSSASIHYYNLDEWVGVSGIMVDYKMAEELEVSVNYKLPNEIKFQIPSKGVDAAFIFRVDGPSKDIYQREAKMTQATFLRLDAQKPQDLRYFQNIIFQFQEFLTLALYHCTYIDQLMLQPAGQSEYFDFYFSQGIKMESKPLNFVQMFFYYRMISERFPDIINKWFELCGELDNVLELLTEQFFRGNRFTENNFLNVAQAAESFHAKLYDHPREDKKAFKARLKRIVDAVPEDEKAFVNDRLSYANILTLADRLRELLGYCPKSFVDKIIIDPDRFQKEIRDSRNYYTHYTQEGKSYILGGIQLLHLSEKIQLMLTFNIFSYIGFSEREISAILESHKYQLRYLNEP